MNKFIKAQLNKCKVAQVPIYSDDDTEIIIPKNTILREIKEFEAGREYQIYVDDSLVKPGNWYDTIHNNWNNGIGPTSNLINIRINKIMGKMINVSGYELDTKLPWNGWLPKGNIKKVKDLD